MMKKTLASLLLASSLAAGCQDRPPQVIAVPSMAELDRPGQMTVTGQATLEVSPDCADMTMTLSADNIRPGAAASAARAEEAGDDRGALKVGVETGDMKLSNSQLDPMYEPNPRRLGDDKVHTYRAQITVTATTKDFTKIAA